MDLAAARASQAPSAGMIRIRFDGLALKPLSPVAYPPDTPLRLLFKPKGTAAALQGFGSAAKSARRLVNAAGFCWIAATGSGEPGDPHDSLFRPDQVPARQILRSRQPLGGCRDRLGNLFDRRRLRPAGQVLY